MAAYSILLFLSLVCAVSLASKNRSEFHEINIKQLRWFPQQECNNVYSSESEKELSKGAIKLMHKLSSCSPYRQQNYSTASFLQADHARYDTVVAKTKKFATKQLDRVPVGPMEAGKLGDYVVEAGLGTPKQSFHPFIDTGSDIAWVPCKPCTSCGSYTSYDVSMSSTARSVSCSDEKCSALGQAEDTCDSTRDLCHFSLSYGDQTSVNGALYSDTLSLSTQTAPDFAFGCTEQESAPNTDPSPGIIGLGKGDVSLITQTRTTEFSYCLPSYNSKGLTGSLALGSESFASNLKWTPMLPNTGNPTFYYVEVSGISVGGRLLSIPRGAFEIDGSTGRGVIVDSGTTLTYLVPEAFDPLNAAFSRSFNFEATSGPLDSCFRVDAGIENLRVPTVTIHFPGVDLELSPQQTLVPTSEDGSVVCLAFTSSSNEISILGNVQQQDTLVAFDLSKNSVGFSPQKCGD